MANKKLPSGGISAGHEPYGTPDVVVTPQEVRAINRMLRDPEKYPTAITTVKYMQEKLREQMNKRKKV